MSSTTSCVGATAQISIFRWLSRGYTARQPAESGCVELTQIYTDLMPPEEIEGKPAAWRARNAVLAIANRLIAIRRWAM
jgi:hypothetical protein